MGRTVRFALEKAKGLGRSVHEVLTTPIDVSGAVRGVRASLGRLGLGGIAVLMAGCLYTPPPPVVDDDDIPGDDDDSSVDDDDVTPDDDDSGADDDDSVVDDDDSAGGDDDSATEEYSVDCDVTVESGYSQVVRCSIELPCDIQGYSPYGFSAVADLDGDGAMDLVLADQCAQLHPIYSATAEQPDFRSPVELSFASTAVPLVGDFDLGTPGVEVVVPRSGFGQNGDQAAPDCVFSGDCQFVEVVNLTNRDVPGFLSYPWNTSPQDPDQQYSGLGTMVDFDADGLDEAVCYTTQRVSTDAEGEVHCVNSAGMVPGFPVTSGDMAANGTNPEGAADAPLDFDDHQLEEVEFGGDKLLVGVSQHGLFVLNPALYDGVNSSSMIVWDRVLPDNFLSWSEKPTVVVSEDGLTGIIVVRAGASRMHTFDLATGVWQLNEIVPEGSLRLRTEVMPGTQSVVAAGFNRVMLIDSTNLTRTESTGMVTAPSVGEEANMVYAVPAEIDPAVSDGMGIVGGGTDGQLYSRGVDMTELRPPLSIPDPNVLGTPPADLAPGVATGVMVFEADGCTWIAGTSFDRRSLTSFPGQVTPQIHLVIAKTDYCPNP